MAEINGWTISSIRTETFKSEDGKNLLLMDNHGEVARVRNNNGNLIVGGSNITTIIDESKKEITIQRR